METTAAASTLASTVVKALARQYEAFPYPCYPLLARPRWQEGYATSAAFAQALGGLATPPSGAILVAGAGEMLPAILRPWEPRHRPLVCVDLSRASLARARWRLRLSLAHGRTHFAARDFQELLDEHVAQKKPGFAHIDCYGVVHHLAEPRRALTLLGQALAQGGTMRLMVYNGTARQWLHHVQALLRLFAYDAHSARDRDAARSLLAALARVIPELAARFQQVGSATLTNDARFVDTFLHCRELRTGVGRWLELLAEAKLAPYALFDRYGELDDLANPLWQMPSRAELEERAADGRFENNLELYVRRIGERPPRLGEQASPRARWPYDLLMKAPPQRWFAYEETASIPWPLRLRLWHAFVRHLCQRPKGAVDGLRDLLPAPAWQRLARLGAVLPGQVGDGAWRAAMATRLARHMEVADTSRPAEATARSEIAQILAAEFTRRQRLQPERLNAAVARCERLRR